MDMTASQHQEMLDVAQAFGCALCGSNVTTEHPLVPGESLRSPSAKIVRLTNGAFQDRFVVVCGECYPRLATVEGIVELTKSVNEWLAPREAELTCDPDDYPLF